MSEILINNVEVIKLKLSSDGDLRNGDFYEIYACEVDDDLGFYQQGCEYLLNKVDELEERVKLYAKKIDNARAW